MPTTELQVDRIIQSMREVLKDGKWDKHLWSFLSSNEMKVIIEGLIELKRQGKFFVPTLENAMYPYAKLPYERVKAVIITSLQTNRTDVSPRLALSGEVLLVKRILNTVHNTAEVNPGDWLKQGVLQVSTVMTSTIGGKDHEALWKPWTSYMVNKLNELGDIPWLMIGREANRYEGMIRSPNKRILQLWPTIDHKDCWQWMNDIIDQQGKIPVRWYTEYTGPKKHKAKRTRI